MNNEERESIMDELDEELCRNIVDSYEWGKSKKSFEECLLKFVIMKNIGYVFVDFSSEEDIKESLETINYIIENDCYSDDDVDDINCVLESMECVFLFIKKWNDFNDEYLKMFFEYMKKYNFNEDYVREVLEDIEI